MAAYDPINYDVLFLLLGHRETLDPNVLVSRLAENIAPWYAFPFLPSVQTDVPAWLARPAYERPIAQGGAVFIPEQAQFVSARGPLATMLPGGGPAPENEEGAPTVERPHRVDFETAWPFVTGIRWVLQHKFPGATAASRGAARNALRSGSLTNPGALTTTVASVGGRVEAFAITAYADRSSFALYNLPFPTTPTLPGQEATYRSGGIFALFAGAAIGGTLLAAALTRRSDRPNTRR